MDSHPRRQRESRRLPQRVDPVLVGEREADGLDRALEEQQEAVALVDLAAPVRLQQLPGGAVVADEQRGGSLVPDPLHETRARDQIADQQRADRSRRSGARRQVAQPREPPPPAPRFAPRGGSEG
jgi:hypothetical protein